MDERDDNGGRRTAATTFRIAARVVADTRTRLRESGFARDRQWRDRQRGFSRLANAPGTGHRATRLGRSVCDALLSLAFPPICVCCGAVEATPLMNDHPHSLLCEACRRSLLADQTVWRCITCGLPSSRWAADRCAECQRSGFEFQQVVSLGLYARALRAATIRMKRFQEFPLTVAVAHLFANQLLGLSGIDDRVQAVRQQLVNSPDVVVPLPKFWVKRILRGTNTSEVLAQVIGQRLMLPVAVGALRCLRNTKKQSLLGQAERRRNVTGAFRLARGYEFRAANVLLVDDIMTTGATASEATKALRAAGANQVAVAIVARAVAGDAAIDA